MPGSLVIQTSYLGDMVLTTPLLAQLARRGAVDVVATPASAPLLAGHPAPRRVIVYDKRGADRGATGLLRLARSLAAERYDTAYLAQGSWRSALLALLARVPARIGFATSAGRLLYTRTAAYRDDMHHAARLLMLARPNGREPTAAELRPTLHPGSADRAAVDALLADAGIATGEPLIGLAPGSVWGAKRWPYFPELATLLQGSARPVVIGGVEDAPLARAIAAATPAAIDATGRLSLLASAELIGRLRALVTNDSLPQHLASAMGVPTLTVFGPTVPAFGFGPLAPGSAVVGHAALPCRPCDRHGPRRCPLGHHRCLRELTAPRLADQLRGMGLLTSGTT